MGCVCGGRVQMMGEEGGRVWGEGTDDGGGGWGGGYR